LLASSTTADTAVTARLNRARLLVSLLRTRGRIREADSVSRSLEGIYVALADSGSALREATQRSRTHAEILGDADGARSLLDDALRAYPLKDMAVMDRPYIELAEAAASTKQADRGAAWLVERAAQVPKVYEHADTSAVDRAHALLDATRGASASALQYARKADVGFCVACGAATVARAFEAAGANDSTIATWERYLSRTDVDRINADQFSLARALKRLGELYEAKGERAKAIDRYSELIELWKRADPQLQPLVTDLKARVARLTARSG
jgi:tetratricopeptide (TPR) repeat protein